VICFTLVAGVTTPFVTVKGHIFVMDYYCEMNGNYPFYADIGDAEFVPSNIYIYIILFNE
jgi:hypothetical protein